MKKWRNVVTIAVILVIALAINTKSFAKTVIITTEGLNLRKEASKTSDVLEVISKDEEVELIEELSEWYKVKYSGMTGYISKDYSKIKETTNTKPSNESNPSNSEPTSKEPEVPTSTTPIESLQEAKFADNAKGYILPLINSNVIQEFKKNQKISIVSTVNGWAYVESNVASAWVRSDKLVSLETQVATTTQQPTANEGDTQQTAAPVTTEKPTANEGGSANQPADNNDEQEPSNNAQPSDNSHQINVIKTERKIMYVQEPSVYVRSGPATTYDVVDSLILNNSVIVTGKADDWYQVQVDGKTGYVASWLLGTSTKETTSRGDAPRNPQNEVKQNDTEVSNNNISKGEQIANFAKNYLGCKYVYGGSGPDTFDCSGFTMYIYNHFGIALSHSATSQSKRGTYVAKEDLQPGDLVFFKEYETMDGIGHCGIYIGGGEFIHASSGTGYCVKISTLLSGSYERRYETARRII